MAADLSAATRKNELRRWRAVSRRRSGNVDPAYKALIESGSRVADGQLGGESLAGCQYRHLGADFILSGTDFFPKSPFGADSISWHWVYFVWPPGGAM